MRVDWDPQKDAANLRKHGIGFDEAKELFTSGVDYLELFNESHSANEDRFTAIGPIKRGLVLVVFAERDDNLIRIISARWATKREQGLYLRYLEVNRA